MKRNAKALLLGICLLAACSKKTDSTTANNNQNHTFADGQVLVVGKDLNQLMKENPDLKKEEVYPEINAWLVRGKSLSGHEIEKAKEWQTRGLVESAEANYVQSVQRTTDPYWIDLWGLGNQGQDAPEGTEGIEGADIHAIEAWTKSTGSKEIIVAVMDTGIDYTHEDLRENIWVNTKELNGEPGKDDDGNGYVDDIHGWRFDSYYQEGTSHGQLGTPDPMDGHGHGTHVSGTIGAVANNGVGIAGINHHVSLMALKVLSDEGSGMTDDIVRAIRYAAKMKVDVVNASFGGGPSSPMMKLALKQLGEAGCLFVAAAGNNASDTDVPEQAAYPADYDLETLMSVAATDNRDQLAEFSNYGYNTVDVAAPGVNILSTYPLALAKKEGSAAHPYRVMSGTSMATPHVTGAAALLLAADTGLRKQPAALKKRLMESADWLPQIGGRVRSGGRLNLAKAVNNETTNLIDQQWIEESYSLQSTALPSALIDQQFVVKKEGAKAIRVHLASSMIDAVDLGALYDGMMRLISFLPSDQIDYWTPSVNGSEVTLRFANALVSVQKVKEKVVVEDPTTLEGKTLCFQRNDDKYDCTVWNEPSDPFGNQRSEGFVVDKIAYVK